MAFPFPNASIVLGMTLLAVLPMSAVENSPNLGDPDYVDNDTSSTPVLSASEMERLSWFRQARFGMFIHWGMYSVPAGEWQGQEYQRPGGGEWIMRNARIPLADYRAFGEKFNASHYQPEAWAALAKEAGMRYVILTAKHHDGFALWNSTASSWNAVQASAAQRDLIGPLAQAVRTQGLRFGLYYSQYQDWYHPGGGNVKKDPLWDPGQKGSLDTYLQTIAVPQVKELIERYQPDVLWWDTPSSTQMTEARCRPFIEMLQQNRQILTNDRLASSRQIWSGDMRTPEGYIPARGYNGALFEVCMSINGSWGYKKSDTHWKSRQRLIRSLSETVSKGGNYLLNIGPTPEGDIPKAAIERLREIGAWMRINGEAIYGTDATPFPRRQSWGVATQKAETDGTTTLYLHVWRWPSDGKLVLPTFSPAPVEGRLLANSQSVTQTGKPEGIEVQLPGAATDPDVSIVRMKVPGKINVTAASYPRPESSGEFKLTPFDADPVLLKGHGGAATLMDESDGVYLGKWSNGQTKLEYIVETPREQNWKVMAEVRSQGTKRSLILQSGKSGSASQPVEIPAIEGKQWRELELGTIHLPAGRAAFSLQPVADKWSEGMEMRTVRLIPTN